MLLCIYTVNLSVHGALARAWKLNALESGSFYAVFKNVLFIAHLRKKRTLRLTHVFQFWWTTKETDKQRLVTCWVFGKEMHRKQVKCNQLINVWLNSFRKKNSIWVLKFSLEHKICITEGVVGQATESEHKSKQRERAKEREAHDASRDRAHVPLCMTILGHRRSLWKNQEVVGHLRYHVTSSTIWKALPH